MRRAFTLIELLTVIGIVAVLGAILFPVLARAKAAAKTTSCLAHIQELGVAYLMYEGDHDGMTVPPRYFNDDGAVSTDIQYWSARSLGTGASFRVDPSQGLLQPYIKGDLLRGCPATRFEETAFPLAYGLNYDLQSVVFENDGKRLRAHQTGIAMKDVELPAETIVFSDLGSAFEGTGGVRPDAELYAPSDPKPKYSNVHGRHAGKANVAWADDHAKSMAIAFIDETGQGRIDRANDLGDLIDPRHPFDGCVRKTTQGACAEDYFFLVAKP